VARTGDRSELSETAAAFLEVGIKCAERGDQNRAAVILDLAEQMYQNVNDQLNLSIVKTWLDPLRGDLALHSVVPSGRQLK